MAATTALSALLALALVCCVNGSPFRKMVDISVLEEKLVDFESGGSMFSGLVAYDETFSGARPVVVIIPGIRGLDDFGIWLGRRMAHEGYVSFSVDLFGKDVERKAFGEFAPGQIHTLKDFLEDNPDVWLSRIRSAVDAVPSLGPFADPSKIAIIGFSEGGSPAIQLARTDVQVAGIVAIHPTTLWDMTAESEEPGFSGRLLVVVGDEQTRFNSENVFAMQYEMKNRGVNYEVTRISKAGDDFMIPSKALDKEHPDKQLASARVWDSVTGFMESIFDSSTVNYLADPWTSTLVDESKLASDYVDYSDGDTQLRGYYAYDKTIEGERPIVLVVPDWNGINEYEIWRAKLLGMMGYVGFVVDMFGVDIEQGNSLPIPKRIELTSGLLGNGGGAAKMRQLAALKAVTTTDALNGIADPNKVAAIGYCFGGSSVLEFMRLQPDGLKGVVSFHGGNLGAAGAEAPACDDVAVLIHNGDDDASVTDEEIDSMRGEFTKAGANWEFVDYSNTLHGFTDPENPWVAEEGGRVAYSPIADSRSWQSAKSFFTRIFAEESLYSTCVSK